MSEFDKEIGILSGAVIIMGTCGSGKSSLGRYIANHSGPDSVFIEGDEHHPIQNITKMSQGSEIRGAIKYILRLSKHILYLISYRLMPNWKILLKFLTFKDMH